MNDMWMSAYFTSMRQIAIIILTLVIGCTETPPVSDPDFIEEVEFSFIQEQNLLYFAVELSNSFETPDTVFIEWYGTDLSNSPDTIPLNDNGTNGDILSNDKVWAIEIENSTSSILSHPIQSGASGTVYCKGVAVSDNNTYTIDREFSLGNIIPSIIAITAPDTVQLPPNSTVTTTFLVACEVFDANGPNDIRRVSFKSYFAENDSAMNEGNAIEMVDDGGIGSYSGDQTADDLVYSVTVNLPVTAILGKYRWIFQAQDNSLAFSVADTHYITVEPYSP